MGAIEETHRSSGNPTEDCRKDCRNQSAPGQHENMANIVNLAGFTGTDPVVKEPLEV